MDESGDWSVFDGKAGLSLNESASKDPDGNQTFTILTGTTAVSDRIIKQASELAVNGQIYTAQTIVNSNDSTPSSWEIAIGKGSEHRAIVAFDPSDIAAGITSKDSSNGTIWKYLDHGFDHLGGGFYRVWMTAKAINLSNPVLELAIWNTSDSGQISVGRSQLELGSTPTPYQSRSNQYDVFEDGQRGNWYLWSDRVDDELVVALPNLGSGVTEFWADEEGATIKAGQTIAAGSRALPNSARVYAFGVIDRALSDSEMAQLQKFLESKSGS